MVYACYLTSDFLDERVRSDRTAFDISDRIAGQPLVDDVSLDDIRETVLEEVGAILKGPLESAREQGKQRVHDYVAKRAPRYRPVLAKIEERGITVDPSVKDQDLELQLHRHLQKIESEAFVQGQEIFAEADAEPAENYAERLADYLATVSEINQSDLACLRLAPPDCAGPSRAADPRRQGREVQPGGRDPLTDRSDADRFQRTVLGRIQPLDYR